MYHLILIFIATLIFTGCGGGGSSSSNSFSSTQQGFLVDSAVSGVEYTCGGIQGITGEDGSFNYNENCQITFSIGQIILGQIDGYNVNSDSFVTPSDLMGVSREDTTNEQVVKLLQFLQTIDTDNNPNNKINISKETREKLKDCEINFMHNDNKLSQLNEIVSLINKQLISQSKAIEHYEKTLLEKVNVIPSRKLLNEKKDFIVKEKPIFEIDEEINYSNNDKKTIDTEEINEQLEETYSLNSESDTNSSTRDSSITISNNLLNEESDKKDVVQSETIHTKQHSFTINSEQKNEESLDSGFSYETQRDVTINIKVEESLSNKQVLLYEEMSLIDTPVGPLEKPEKQIISTVFDTNGELQITHTLGNHVQSIWVIIPYYGIVTEVEISNNNIYLVLN